MTGKQTQGNNGAVYTSPLYILGRVDDCHIVTESTVISLVLYKTRAFHIPGAERLEIKPSQLVFLFLFSCPMHSQRTVSCFLNKLSVVQCIMKTNHTKIVCTSAHLGSCAGFHALLSHLL